MEPRFRPDLEREFSIRQRGTVDVIELKGSASSRHWAQQDKIKALPLSNDLQELLRPAFIRYWGPGKNLCLFNIIVAFEWAPNYNDLRLLREATASASDLLYDVTDGYMAIGAVFVGGLDLMHCADIQIFASNRLFPRSTVDGLNDPQKYQPIRIGRGIWQKTNRITIPWDSEMGFGTLVHEWGHYGLGLKDQYLKKDNGVVIPVNNPVLDTIMAGIEKTELLSSRPIFQPRDPDGTPDSEWAALRSHPKFGWLEIPEPYVNKKEVPPEQPTPAFYLIGKAREARAQRGTHEEPHPVLQWELIQLDGAQLQIDEEHCWVFLVQGGLSNPDKLIAQGELERAGSPTLPWVECSALTLLDARQYDTIVLIGQTKADPVKPLILSTTINGIKEERKVSIDTWKNHTPPEVSPEIPLLAVQAQDASGANQTRQYKLTLRGTNLARWQALFFPFAEQRRFEPDIQVNITALDGHVMLIPCNEDTSPLVIAGYSLGGSPDSGFPVHPNPIPAGSSDGNAMIFFYEPLADRRLDYLDINLTRYQKNLVKPSEPTLQAQNGNLPALDSYRIVTTTNYLSQKTWLDHWEPRSYTFGVTTNQTLAPLKAYLPTLVLYFDKKAFFYEKSKADSDCKEKLEANKKNLVIARYDQVNNKWIPQPTVQPKNSIAALALDEKSAPGLFPDDGQLKPEYFRLFLITE